MAIYGYLYLPLMWSQYIMGILYRKFSSLHEAHVHICNDLISNVALSVGMPIVSVSSWLLVSLAATIFTLPAFLNNKVS